MPKRIYQIGFNRCGTLSFHQFFIRNGIRSVHWDWGNLSRSVYDNFQKGRPLFEAYPTIQAFNDMEHLDEEGNIVLTAQLAFKEMYKQDPEGLFILNIRNKENWLKSRAKHLGHLSSHLAIVNALKTNKEEVFRIWSDEFDRHIAEVTDFFSKQGHLLVFNIEDDDPELLETFLNTHGFKVSRGKWQQSHQTGKRESDFQIRINAAKHLFAAGNYFFEDEPKPELALQIFSLAQIEFPKEPVFEQRVLECKQWVAEMDKNGAFLTRK